MKKKFLALVLTLAMVLSLVPVTALATNGTEGGASQENTRDNLTMKKTVIPNEDGTYTVRLESYATGSVTTTQAPVPMDFVLVLDVSGSMTDEIASYTYQVTDKTSWSVSDVYDAYYDRGGWHRTDVTYYAKIGDEYYPVSYKQNWVSQGWFSGYYEYWLEANNEVLGHKVTDSTWEETVYNQALYTRQTDSDKTVAKLDAMKTAVNNFITTVAAQKNGDTPVAHRISIVKFAGNSKNEAGNNRYNNNKYNYTQKVTELTDVTNDGSVASLKDAVNALNAGGATRANLGMEKAAGVLNGRQNAEKDRPSVVIMFTDGEPTTSDTFEWKVAGATVDTSKTLKDNRTKVYTIGMFSDANPSDTNNAFNKYMNGVSSNYLSAFGTKDYWNNYNDITLGKRTEGSNYYFKADNAGDLDQVFQKISETTTTTSPLDASAVVVDKVPSNFKAPENVKDVTLKVADYKNGNTFGEEIPAPDGISATVKDGTVSVTGFDFSKNWCGPNGTTPHGQKLIIEFNISRTNYGGTQPTNAGAYIKAGKEADEKPIISLDNPEVPVTISLGSKENSLKNPEVKDEKPYDGTGLAILPKIAEKANALATGTDNAYVNMDLTVTVDGTTYTYKIRAGETAGKWYEGSSTTAMTDTEIDAITTPKDVNRDRESNKVEPYTYTFDLKLSDANPKGAESGAESKEYKDNNASFKITPKAVTVKVNDQQVQKGTDPNSIPYTATVNGLVNGEQESLISHTINCDGYTVDTDVGSELEITATGAEEQGNYTVTYQPGKLTVVEAPVTTGILKVTKEVQGDDLTLKSLPSDFKITVTGPNSYSESFPLPENVGDSDKTVTWTIRDLTPGEYTVGEENAGVNGYDWTATYSATNGATVIVNSDASAVQNQPTTDAQASQKVTVTAGVESTMTVTNKYTKQQEVVPTPDTSKPDVNKTATDLVNDKTDVTLSVGGKSAKENVAVMFLLDKSTSMGTRTEAAKMLQHLKDLTNTNIIYDVVIFSGTASSTGWQNISNELAYTDTQKNFANREPSSGTNMPVGIDKAIQDMETLNSQYSSYAKNAYLITISDGITYLWNEGETTYTVPLLQKEGNNIYPNVHPNVDTWDMMYGKGTSIASVYTSFEGFLNTIPGKIQETRNGNYVREYLTETDAGDKTDATNALQISTADPEKSQVSGKYACAPEFSVYYSTTKYENLVKPFTKSFALPMPEIDENGNEKTKNWENYPWGEELMIYLQSMSSNVNQGVVHDADAKTIFAGIQNKILYQIQSGSITDVIGADFSLTDQTLTKDTFTLTVNGKAVTANAPNGNEITFGEQDKSTGKYPYVLTYYKGTATKNADNTYTITSGEKTYTYTPYDTTGEVNGPVSDEFFVLEMNVPVVSLDLKYNLSLTSKRTASGTYEVPTNESATLAYQSANQSAGSVDFNEPTVSYRVKGSSGGHSGGTVTIPDDVPTGLNGKDHYAYVVGYPDGMVYPQKNITRAEVATIFFRLLEDETREANMTKSNSYNDMKDGAWYTCAVSTLSKMGIIKGYEDGSFKPDASISRAEFAAIAARFDPDGDKTPATFSDVSSHWAKDEISIAANHGWIKGYEDGSFKPDQKITRAETMTLVNRVLKRLPETKDDLHKDMKTWPDNQKESAWFYLAVQEATNSHYQKLKKDGIHETWESMRETRDWAALEK